MINIRRIVLNPALLFTANKYVVFGLQLVRGVLVAKFLGPYLFGIWGFMTLLQQYLQYVNLGLPYAVNVQFATGAINDLEKRRALLSAAFSITVLLASLLAFVGLGIQILNVQLFNKYSFNQYAGIVGIGAGLFQIELLFTFIYRVYGRLAKIAASDVLGALMLLLGALAFKREALIMALLWSLVLSKGISIMIFMIRAPFEITFSLESVHIKSLLVMGIPLLVYNLSNQLITIVARTTISAYYAVETLGYYSLASSISAISLLGVSAVTWIAFPGLLSRTREGLPDAVVAKTIARVNDIYVTAVFLTVFVTILLLPAVFVFLPQYKPAEGVLDVLLLSEGIFSISFAYNCGAQARNKQVAMAAASLVAVAVVAALGLLVALFKLDFVWVAIAVLAGAFVQMLLQVRIGLRLLNHGRLHKGYLRNILPWGGVAGIFLFLLGGLTGHQTVLGGVGLFVFAFGSRRQFKQLWHFAFQRLGFAKK